MTQGTAVSSGVLATGTHLIRTGRGTLNSIVCLPSTFIQIQDNTSGSGTTLYVQQGTTMGETKVHTFATPVRCLNGLFVTVFGTGCIVNHSGG